MTDFKKNLLLSCVSLLFSLAAGEVIIRIYENSAKDVSQGISDPILLYRMSGGEFDANGFRNREVPAEADIVALGDSFTQGINATMGEAWPRVVGTLSSTTVYNMGISGYGAVQYAALSKQAFDLHPKIVIVGFYLGNDLYDAYNVTYHLPTWKALRDPGFIDPNVKDEMMFDPALRMESLAGAKQGTMKYNIFATRLWIRNHIRLYALLGDATRALREKSGIARTADDQMNDLNSGSKEDPNIAIGYDGDPAIKTILSPVYRYDAVDLSATTTKEGWRITRDLFTVMNNASTASGTTLVIVAIPTKEAMYLKHMHNVNESIPQKFIAYEAAESKLLSSFMDFCAEQKIRCMSPLPDLAKALDEHQTIVRPVMDGHPLPSGYRVIAESVYKYLRTQNLLPVTNISSK
ncbi:MAG: hypothetical protein A2845_03395 [Candidatus Lloydbacteria bacterium RIFCSPHIGHO2_01_FULL_49_22]|uniref:SGNH hydrolase-type esterase domain-containing protein n=1 Tax=Candidatus Lloydbacteria bacterium RIFCSPHIGHO2_01_FULL_49_22 TaxID=1798658 RepID=A0A1G2CWT1_9BACT|nr:MAG: hypothetical protein A2845_03395 [Candidatus Lloydbacteria bacterium RIFCSPHIGHO2_01_FULL_49_22]OGZ08976.1 MAG: hypothetical protein A3C14_03230 [Candidatus Lloydbacteria bacterium RIFCSPHIGHO2_02_FULL_50_18]